MERSIRRQLTTELVRLHRAPSSVQGLLDAAGIHNHGLVSWSDRPINSWKAILTYVVIQEQLQDLFDVGVDKHQKGVIFQPVHYAILLQPQPKSDIPHSPDPFPAPGAAERIMDAENALLLIIFLKRGLEFTLAITQTVKGQKFASGLVARGDTSATNRHVTTIRLRSEAEASDAWKSVPVATIDLSTVRNVNIIQRPNDMSKMIDLHPNLLVLHSGRTIDHYTDTLPGRSGCLMFDSAWRLVGVQRGEPHLRGPEGTAICCNRDISGKVSANARAKLT